MWRCCNSLLLLLASLAHAQSVGTWTRQIPQNFPPPRAEHALAYDVAHSQVVLFGGQADDSYLGDTWVWDGANWTEKSPQTSPGARQEHAMAYDAAHSQVVLFGGVGSGSLGGEVSTTPGSGMEPIGLRSSPPTARPFA